MAWKNFGLSLIRMTELTGVTKSKMKQAGILYNWQFKLRFMLYQVRQTLGKSL